MVSSLQQSVKKGRRKILAISIQLKYGLGLGFLYAELECRNYWKHQYWGKGQKTPGRGTARGYV